jgi:hypothetical protein
MSARRYGSTLKLSLGLALAMALSCDGTGELRAGASGSGAVHGASLGIGGDAWCSDPAENPALRFLPLSDVLQVLPPLGVSTGNRTESDASLLDFATVSICRVDGSAICTRVAEFTSGRVDHSDRHHGEVALQGNRYRVNWKMPAEPGAHEESEYEVHFGVADLELGYVTYSSAVPRTLPIQFTVDHSPLVRAAVLSAQEVPVTRMAEALVNEFDLSVTETAWVFRALEFGLDDLYLILTETFGIGDVFEIESLFDSLCIPPEEYLEITALENIERFAPALRFDRAYWGLPQTYRGISQRFRVMSSRQ